jgi:hypothetical protein
MDRHPQQGTRHRRRTTGIVSLLAIAVAAAIVPAALSTIPHDRARALARQNASSPGNALAGKFSAPASSTSAPDPFRLGVVLVGFGAGVTGGQRYAIERAAGGLGASYIGPLIRPVHAAGRASSKPFIPTLKLSERRLRRARLPDARQRHAQRPLLHAAVGILEHRTEHPQPGC